MSDIERDGSPVVRVDIETPAEPRRIDPADISLPPTQPIDVSTALAEGLAFTRATDRRS